MSSIIYTYGENLYINLTNRCPCACSFCIRQSGDGVGSVNSLWLNKEPTANEVISELNRYDPAVYGDIVFCGYGEPFCAFEVMLTSCREIRKSFPDKKIRINTNGLGDLINGRNTASELSGLADMVSISLNAPDAERYEDLCKPEFGAAAFPAIIEFARNCKQYFPAVQFSVVNVIGKHDIDACRKIADKLGIMLKIRTAE